MRRIITAREQAELLSPWQKTADDLMVSAPPGPQTLDSNVGVQAARQPPTTTNIPRSQFDNILASKGVTYDQHLDNLESHYNAATEDQKKRGRVWYRAGGDTLRDIGKKFGITTNRAISMAAALSARTDWNNNLHFAAHMAGNYRPGENEDEWRRANIHPSAMARYMESKYDITPGEKEAGDRSNPDHFSAKELKGLHEGGYMPRTKADFNQLADAHSGNHLQYTPGDKKKGTPGRWDNKPLRGFEELQTPEGRAAWLKNAQMPNRGGTETERKPYEDAIDGHMRAVKDTTSPYGYLPSHSYTGAGVPTLGGNIQKAKLLRTVGEDEFDKHLNGPKYKAFFSNLGNNLKFLKADRPEDQGYYDHGGKHWSDHDPDYLRSTIDTQHMRAASQPHGSSAPAPGYKEASQVTPEQYEVYQQGMADLTHRINSKLPKNKQLMPHQVQAIIWGKFKDDQAKKKSGAGQTYFSPTMDDVQPFADRYSRFLAASEQEHVDPRLLEPPLSDPYQTDSDDWWENVLESWLQRHQQEVGPHHPHVEEPPHREASKWYLSWTFNDDDSFLNQKAEDILQEHPRAEHVHSEEYTPIKKLVDRHLPEPVLASRWFVAAPPENSQRTQRPGTMGTYNKAHAYFDTAGAPGKGTDGVLDYGAGLGHSAQFGHTYEPYPRQDRDFRPTYEHDEDIPEGAYNRVTNLNVLNVVPPELRSKIVQGIGRAMAPGGHAVITTRGTHEVLNTKSGVPADNGDPNAIRVNPDTPNETYQKGFTPDELHQYVSDQLGPGYTVHKVKIGPAGVHVVKHVGRQVSSRWYTADTVGGEHDGESDKDRTHRERGDALGKLPGWNQWFEDAANGLAGPDPYGDTSRDDGTQADPAWFHHYNQDPGFYQHAIEHSSTPPERMGPQSRWEWGQNGWDKEPEEKKQQYRDRANPTQFHPWLADQSHPDGDLNWTEYDNTGFHDDEDDVIDSLKDAEPYTVPPHMDPMKRLNHRFTAGGGYDNPWEGEQAEALRKPCGYCTSPDDMHDVDCPTLYSDSPREWRQDKKLKSPQWTPGPEHDHHTRLNSRWYTNPWYRAAAPTSVLPSIDDDQTKALGVKSSDAFPSDAAGMGDLYTGQPSSGGSGGSTQTVDYVPGGSSGGSALSLPSTGTPTASPPSTGGGAPVSYNPSGGSEQWRSVVDTALQRNGLPTSLDSQVLKQVQTESSGNPNAINNWDSNAKAGHPSQGLLQTIPSTFNQYKLPGDSSNILDPQANADAAVDYAKSTYGPTLMNNGNGMGSGHGY